MLTNNQGLLQRSLPKIAVGLLAATIAPVIVAVVFVPLLVMIADYGCEGTCAGVAGSLFVGMWFGICAGPIAMLHALLLGLPAAIIGARLERIRWWSSTLVGFMIGCVPTGIYVISDLPILGDVQTVIDKNSLSFTSSYLMMLLFGLGIRLIIILPMGFFGAVGGISFWAVWQMLTRRQSSEIINSSAS